MNQQGRYRAARAAKKIPSKIQKPPLLMDPAHAQLTRLSFCRETSQVHLLLRAFDAEIEGSFHVSLSFCAGLHLISKKALSLSWTCNVGGKMLSCWI